MFSSIASYLIQIIRLKPFLSIFYFFSLLLVFTQCTVQKRLYNRGYHIEHKTKFRSGESIQAFDSIRIQPSVSQNNDFILDEEIETTTNFDEADHVTDTTVAIANSGTKRDTIYVQVVTKRQADQQKKRANLIGLGLPTLGLGLVAAGCFSQAAAAEANLSALLFFGAIGWLCALAAAILLIIFLVFLCIPVADDPTKETKQKTGLSKGERSALTVILIVIGIIGLAFFISGNN